MKTIEIWPKDVEGGDFAGQGISGSYLRMTDPESGLEVIAMLRPEALQTLVTQIGAMVARQKKPN